ncbi:MAG: hypothetical protein GY854_00040 [Deltaproteobacteria bacterium]|nr:hypothetical protein [Deltaproteobacteria bacterium]
MNTYTTESQLNPSVTRVSGHGFVVVWASNGQDGDGYGIYGQRYDEAGEPISDEFRVNTYTTGYQNHPETCMASDGSFTVVWQSDGQDNDNGGIFGQRYDNLGILVDDEFQVNAVSLGNQDQPCVSKADDGSFVVTWAISEGEIVTSDLCGQRFDADGVGIGDEFQISTASKTSGHAPDTSIALGVGIFIVWSEWTDYTYYQDIYMRRYDASGSPSSSKLRINKQVTVYNIRRRFP